MQEEGGERGASDASPGQAPDTKGSDGVEQGSRRHVPGRGLSKEAVGPELSISIPLPLKKQLVADEKMIVHKGEVRGAALWPGLGCFHSLGLGILHASSCWPRISKQAICARRVLAHVQLLELPARPTVQEILDRFLEQRGQELTASRHGTTLSPHCVASASEGCSLVGAGSAQHCAAVANCLDML